MSSNTTITTITKNTFVSSGSLYNVSISYRTETKQKVETQIDMATYLKINSPNCFSSTEPSKFFDVYGKSYEVDFRDIMSIRFSAAK